MKTKPFLLATAGSTVDGRTIDENMLKEVAKSYDPQTYGARVNIEHIRGISGEKPFRAYGDVLELSTAEVEVNFNGKTEKRLGLYGVLDVTDEAKKLSDEGQKVYPSIEIEPNFAGKGFAYCMGVALTDSPASIATERLQFNRTLPGTIQLSRASDGQPEGALPIEFSDAAPDQGEEFTSRFGKMLESVFSKFAPAKVEEKPKDPVKEDGGSAFNVADLKPLFEGLGQSFSAELATLRTEMNERIDGFAVKLKTVETTLEGTPSTKHTARPAAAGPKGQFAKTDC
jgi:hypothetical protein